MSDQITRALSAAQIAAIEAQNNPRVEEKPKAPAPVVEFVPQQDKQLTLTVPLDFPVTVDGELVTEIVIRRPKMREWRAYIRECVEAVDKNGEGADDLVDQPWLSLRAVVIEELDYLDATRLETAQQGFFGRSALPLETEGMTSDSTSETGEGSPSE
ncbi:phage tail assembly protein [Agrobacterium tumefaciens]|uniref:phage tail assembly protein n=1 Tax=Agrobacterium tumefaciens TaxID=358 RepID=UPI0015740522|nr:phage tail assembly protein [Agrobacterium tumefaciens]NTD85502.1 phage tail assembly protein [Agrobacterium tumefaciens]NTD90851.1 phage tail assembly protein [Agrobacterium tumefaciens]NTE03673.1 phage tail assembly protein [Agrobacterium tumefaciens]NTE15925.1 phage tail assembly protein [Agrobacterium tumefaciens]NTE26499.1 phage tail assembly protein [Agrobacterium tumefaciens]